MGPPRAGSNLLDYWVVLVRRRWVIYLSVLSITVLALIGSFVATPLYRSTVTLQLERESPDVLTFRDLSKVDSSWAAYSDFYQTQYKIIASQPVAKLAVKRLGLDGHPMIDTADSEPGLLSRLRSIIPSRGIITPIDPIDAAALMLLGGLEVAPVRNSHLVLVSYVGTEPQLSADVANAIAKAYQRYTIETQHLTSETATDFLRDQIIQLQKEVQDGERELQDYGAERGILTIDDASNVTLTSVREVAAQLTAAQTVRAEAKARLDTVKEAQPNAMPAVLESLLISRLRGDFAVLESEYTQKAQRFKDDWPGMRELKSKLDQSRLRLDLEMEQIAEQVKATAEAQHAEASNRERELKRLLKQREKSAQNLKQDAIEYATQSSTVEKKREILDRLIKRQSEIAVSERLLDVDDHSTNIRIMEAAQVPSGPFKPNTRLNVLLGLVLGVMVGVALANVLDYLDNSVKSPSELEKLTEVPLLAVIQHHGGANPALARVRRRQSTAAPSPFDLITHFDSRSPVAEAYRELRTALLLSHAGEPPRRIMVTSGMPQEGKSATSMNLSTVLAQMDRRVLLVDTDLRRPRLHRALQARNETGVSTFLSGLEDDPLRLVQGTIVDNLFVLTSGPIPPNPSELLNSPRFSEMTQRLLDSGFDHIVFDSPPVLSVSEPVIISSTVDSTILVVRAGQTPRQSITLAIERLQKSGRRPTGIVLNDAKLDGQGTYYQRYYYSAASDVAPGETSKVEGRQAGGAA